MALNRDAIVDGLRSIENSLGALLGLQSILTLIIVLAIPTIEIKFG
jgi:hypothetical protein